MGGALSGTLGSPGALRTESLPTRAPLWGLRNRLLSRREHGIVRGYLRLFLRVIFHRVCRIICGVVAWVPCEAWRPMTTPTTRPAAGRGSRAGTRKRKKVGAFSYETKRTQTFVRSSVVPHSHGGTRFFCNYELAPAARNP